MNAEQYRALLADLELSQRGAARVMGVNERTSRNYASKGVPEKHSPWVRDTLNGWAESFKHMVSESEKTEEDDATG